MVYCTKKCLFSFFFFNNALDEMAYWKVMLIKPCLTISLFFLIFNNLKISLNSNNLACNIVMLSYRLTWAADVVGKIGELSEHDGSVVAGYWQSCRARHLHSLYLYVGDGRAQLTRPVDERFSAVQQARLPQSSHRLHHSSTVTLLNSFFISDLPTN